MQGYGRALTTSLAAGLLVLGVLSLLVGPAGLTPAEIWAGIRGTDGAASIIVREIRAPRLLLAIGVGATLGLCGAAAQSLTRNPLAEPTLFGTPQAAALGAVAVLYSGLAGANSLLLPIAAICCAILSLGVVLWLARRSGSVLSLLLIGLGIGSMAGAATSLVISFSNNPYAVMEIVFWLLGSFEDRSMQHVLLSFPFFLIAGALIWQCRNGYQALTLGEDVAQSLGVDVRRIGLLTTLGIAAGVGAGVAVSGAIGFVGLVAPHIVRPFFSGHPGRILVASSLAGATITTAADILVRLLPSTSEIRIGVLTAFIGVPLFIYLVVKGNGFSTGEEGR